MNIFRASKYLTNILAGLILLVFSAWIFGFIVFTGSVSAMQEPDKITHTDAIIVLTGGSNRVARALQLLSEEKTDRLLISGVGKNVSLSDFKNDWPYPQPLPKNLIQLDFVAENTLGNAREAQYWVKRNDIKTIRLITATYHMPRSLLEFRHTLPGASIQSHPVLPDQFMPDTAKFWQLCFLEYHKLILSFFRTKFFPADTNPFPTALK